MKTGLFGFADSGKTTVFEALTHNQTSLAHKNEAKLGTIFVPDRRLDVLSRMYKPVKTTPAQVEYFLPGQIGQGKETLHQALNQVRDCDALIQVIRNFGGYGFKEPAPRDDLIALEQELILADLVVADKRLERLEAEHHKGKKANPEEMALLASCRQHLEKENPLRTLPELAEAPLLKGYRFLSAKPKLMLINNPDEIDRLPELGDLVGSGDFMVIRAKLEKELAQMSPEEAADFLAEFNIPAPATDRVIKKTYQMLGLISFFTVGDDEVRAWTIRAGTPALDAAGAVHTDMKKGFIRAEVVAYEDLIGAGSYVEARKKGTVRLEGKTYVVRDGDVINFRFNV